MNFEQYIDSGLVSTVINVALLFGGAWALFFIFRIYLVRLLARLTKNSDRFWSELLFDTKFLTQISWIIPILAVHKGIELLPDVAPTVALVIHRVSIAILVLVALAAFSRLLTRANEIYLKYPVSRNRPIKGYLQVILIISYILGAILIVSILLDRSPLVFISGLGAMTAILLLVFRDTLLSLVAGIQLTSNDLIRVGDWIEMPQFDADGDVVDIALHTVKVQNWDKTITVIPTHKFLEHSFKNWRGMTETGGRRIKRSIFIDLNSIRFLTEDEIEHFKKFVHLKDYIEHKRIEIEEHNKRVYSQYGEFPMNGRALTNVGTFRAYLTNYLRSNPNIHKDLTFLVRQLQPGPTGLPIEIYVFSNDVKWANYEGIQADIFDHVFAIAKEFGLRLFQNPSGEDFRSIIK